MNSETTNEGHDIFVIDIDGRRSDPITPRTPKEEERIARLREKYIKAGLIKDEVSKPSNAEAKAG